MKKTCSVFVIVVIVQLIFAVSVFGEVSYPSPTGTFFVNDFAGVLKPETENLIASMGKELETKTGAQVVLVTISSLEGEDIDSFSNELFNKWGIGQKDKDNGILILNAVGERMLRIEVGYGLEGAVPDIKTAEIREKYMNPYLKQGDYDSGLYNGYMAVVNEVAKEYGVDIEGAVDKAGQYSAGNTRNRHDTGSRVNFGPFMLVAFLVFDGIFFRFRITSMIIKILFLSSFFRGGRGGGGWRGGGFGGGFGGGGFGGSGSSGGGGRSGGGGSSGGY